MAFALYLPAQGTLNVSLFAQYNRGDGRASGSWAYVAPDGSEYAVLGASTGAIARCCKRLFRRLALRGLPRW